MRVAGYGMTVNMARSRITIKISRRKQDLLILADGMRDSFKIEGWVRDEKQKI